MGRKAWAFSDSLNECNDGDESNEGCLGSLRDGLIARDRNRAASHFVRGARIMFHTFGGMIEPDSNDGIAQSPVELPIIDSWIPRSQA